MIALTLFSVSAVMGQSIFTLSEAVTLALNNNISLKKQQAAIKKAESQLLQSGQFPNPLMSYSGEILQGQGPGYEEWSISGSYPLNYFWERGTGIKASEKTVEAQKLLLNHLLSELTAKTVTVYSSHYIYQKLTQRLDTIYIKVKELSEAVRNRLKEGDISEYEMQRILIELQKIIAAKSDAASRKRQAGNELKLLTGKANPDIITTEKPFMRLPGYEGRDEAILTGIEKRSDLAAAVIAAEGAEADLSYNKLQSIPDILLSAGYKKQTGDLSGTVFSLDVEIPLFNRNQSGIQQSETELSLLQSEIQYMKEKIRTEIADAFDEYLAANSLFTLHSQHDFRSLLTTILFSYESGELSLVELTDGLRTCVEGLTEEARLEGALYSSVYKLQQLSAAAIILSSEE
ncbi:MAG: hypothetical protein FMNOHCHN_00246 [Ignavibacteriaceae bacterium]|nr:hypothetical protein [Ignavibacteriaceae bacterium]